MQKYFHAVLLSERPLGIKYFCVSKVIGALAYFFQMLMQALELFDAIMHTKDLQDSNGSGGSQSMRL